MGWEPLLISLEAWFADAWARGMHPTATDLAWLVATLRHPALTVSPGLKVVLEAAAREPTGYPDDPLGRADAGDGPELSDEALIAVSTELRRAVERHGRLGEAPARYRTGIRAAAAGCRVRSP